MDDNNKYVIVLANSKKEFESHIRLNAVVINKNASKQEVEKALFSIRGFGYYCQIYKLGREVDIDEI